MQTLVFTIIIMLVSFDSCNKEPNEMNVVPGDRFCQTENPLEEIPWLKMMKQSFEMSAQPAGVQIIGYRYHGKDVFLVNNCVGCADEMAQVYDCDGRIICQFGGIAGLNTCPDFFVTATDSTMLYNSVQE